MWNKDESTMQGANGPALNVNDHQQIAGLTTGAKKEVATTAVQTLGANAVDAQKEFATVVGGEKGQRN